MEKNSDPGIGTFRLLFVFGTRPEAIKLAPVILKAKSDPQFSVKVCVTGQHREMLDQALDFFAIKPDFDFNVMRPNQTLNGIACAVIDGLNELLDLESFDCVLVHGDTTTTMSASLAAFHKKVPVGHVEAGLRTHDLSSPWPEEMNRRVAGLLSTWHFAPTEESQNNLISEGVRSDSIFKTGNTVIDALNLVIQRLESDQALEQQMRDKFSFIDDTKKMVLVTGHRRENFGAQFLDICEGLKRIALNHDVQIVYPVHLNPNVQKPVLDVLAGLSNIILLEPQDYVPFVYLMKKSYLIITDSGGVQEEAPSLGKPVLVMRQTTERPEAVTAGTVRLVGPSGDRIFEAASTLLTVPAEYEKMSRANNPYGDGLASQRILEKLKSEIRV